MLYEASVVLTRQWAGLEHEAEMLCKEIARVRSLISRAAYDLEHAGAQSKAQRLLRAPKGDTASTSAPTRRSGRA